MANHKVNKHASRYPQIAAHWFRARLAWYVKAKSDDWDIALTKP